MTQNKQKRGKPRKAERNLAIMKMYLKALHDNEPISCKQLGIHFGLSEGQTYRLLKREMEEQLVDKPFQRKQPVYRTS